jgi:4,5-DOPA dioxygenase extradiol
MTATQRKAPVFFISHGAPTFALEPGILGPQLHAMGEQLADVKAVVVVSPHWQTRDLKVMTTTAPETVHDFGGFPAALYTLRYPAPGQPALAAEVGQLLTQAGLDATLDDHRGLDHGAWVPLWHMLPKAQIPVFQVSMPHNLTTLTALQLGQALAAVRERGVMVLASGSMTHNLYEIEESDAPAHDYAVEFAHWVRQAVSRNDTQQLVNYRRLAPHAQRAHPSEEHFLPLLVAMGARTDSDALNVLKADITHGVLSMESYAWGMQ